MCWQVQGTVRELDWNNVTRLEFFDAVYDESNHPNFPYGGTIAQQHCRYSDEWRVHLLSPFPDKGWMPLKHPKYGWLMPKEVAIQFARKMRP